MSRRGVCHALCGLAVFLATPRAGATFFVNDPFSYPEGNLAGQTPSPGPGAAWNAGSATGVNAIQVANSEAVVRQIKAINSEDVANVFGAQSATATTFARFDFRIPAADNGAVKIDPLFPADGVFFVSLRGSGASALRARTGLLAPASGGDFRLAVNADSSNLALGAIWASDLSFDTTYRAIVSYSATDAVGKLWLNPVDESSTSVMQTGTITGTAIDRVVLRQNDDYDGKQIIDNLVVASTFAEALDGPVAGVPGDYNGNNTVDAADYVVWREAESVDATSLANRDPMQGTIPVGSADYDFWRARFGNSSGPASGTLTSIAAPEPATVVLLGIAIAACSPRRRTVKPPATTYNDIS